MEALITEGEGVLWEKEAPRSEEERERGRHLEGLSLRLWGRWEATWEMTSWVVEREDEDTTISSR